MELNFLDTASAFVIICNTVFMGVRLDMDDDPERRQNWVMVDMVFTSLFAIELLLRVVLKGGFVAQFCAEEKFPRWFDAGLIIMDITQITIDFAGGEPLGGAVSVSLFRILRFGRFIRIIRLTRTAAFGDLVAMMSGIGGGVTTLVWSALLFALMVYVAALLCREAFGRNEASNVSEYFDSVPRSMFTVFRCSFGDCSSSGGVPIFEHVHAVYGGSYSLLYCFFVFIITIGLFNVISAIFVDGAMSAAFKARESQLQQRLNNDTLMSTNVALLIRKLLDAAHKGNANKISENIHDLGQVEIERNVLDQVIQDSEVIQALNNLDIDPHDHSILSDILDPDHGGTVAVLDIMNGLQRLRGQPRRSDIVSVNLMIRSLQDKFEDLLFHAKQGGF
jgi:hypothetical protein